MNSDNIIKKYKLLPEDPHFILEGGRIVVGEEVDENNQLHYIIRDGTKYTIESAWNQSVIKRIEKDTTIIKLKTSITPYLPMKTNQ